MPLLPPPHEPDPVPTVGDACAATDRPADRQLEMARLAAIVESSEDAILSKDLEGRITSWNHAAQRLYGYAADEVVGSHVGILMTDPAEAEEILASLRLGRRIKPYETHRRRRDGSLVDVSVAVSPVRDATGCVVGGAIVARDISERKRAEQALRRSEWRHRALLSQLPDAAVCQYDRDLRLVMADGPLLATLGVTPEHIVGRTVWEVLPADRAEQVAAAYRAALDGTPRSFRWDAVSGDRVLAVDIVPMREGDRTEGAMMLARDITERTRAEHRLLVKARLLDQLEAAVVATDPDGLVTHWNRQAERYYQRDRDDVIGRPFAEIGAARTPGRDLLTSTSAIHDERGATVGFANVAVDVTAARRAAEDLHQARGMFESAFAAAPIGIALMSVGDERPGSLLRVNDALSAMLDRTSEGLAGVPFTDLVHSEDTDRVRSAVRELLAGTAESPQLELRLVDAAGEPVWSAVSVALVRDAAGKPLHAVVLLQDQTDTRRAQEEKHALERRLHQSQKLDGLGRLAGGIAHDFNNLLAVILNYANFVADQLPPGGQLYADVEQISEAASRAAALTRQLLAFGRRQVVQTQALDLNAVVTSTEELLRRTIGEDIELRSRLTPDLHLVRADQSQMEQVLVNLAVNGRDAMPTGGVLTITTENVEEAGQVRLTVTDTGTGMSAEVIQHAFEPFFTTKPPAQGTGLGLATVYGIATRDGGDVDIASEPGRGTAVSVVLPVCAAGATGEQEGEQDTAPAARGESVLVVEDEEGVRGLTERILRDAGYRVRTALRGEEGLTLARELRPDLVLTDVVMPGMSGSSLARAIATELPEIQVVFMCGYTDDVVTRHGVAERRFALLEKPFTRTALLRAVRDALDTGPAGPADV